MFHFQYHIVDLSGLMFQVWKDPPKNLPKIQAFVVIMRIHGKF